MRHDDIPKRRKRSDGDSPQARSTLPAGERHLGWPAGRRKMAGRDNVYWPTRLQRAYESANTAGSAMVILDAQEAAVGFHAAHAFLRLRDFAAARFADAPRGGSAESASRQWRGSVRESKSLSLRPPGKREISKASLLDRVRGIAAYSPGGKRRSEGTDRALLARVLPLPCANRCSAVAPPTLPVTPVTKTCVFS
jgi:hypothetical protein